MSAEKQKLLDDLDAARTRLEAALNRLGSQAQVYAPWRVKELLDHLAGWDEAVLTAFRSHAAGEVPALTAPDGIDAYNARSVAARLALPPERSRQEFLANRQMLKALILALPEDKFQQPMRLPWGQTGTVSQVVEIFIEHEHEHAHDLEKLLANPQA